MELTAEVIRDWQRQLAEAVLPTGRTAQADAERIEILRAIEDFKATGAAVQADAAVAFEVSQRAQQAAAGEPSDRQGRGVASQIALARRESPHRGQVLLAMAKDLAGELPHTSGALRDGWLSEYRAQLIVAATSGLDPDKRAEVDAALCGDPQTLAGVGNRELAGKARAAADKLDPAAATRRRRRAPEERRVSTRPAPDGMLYFTGLVEMVVGVAMYGSLKKEADRIIGLGDPLGRTHAQVMADVLAERITGQAQAGDVPVQVDLIISDTSLLGGGTEPALVPGHGAVPAEIARHLIAHALDLDAAWLRRLYADPSGRLVAMSTNQRLASDALAAFLRIRDQGICRTPWCDAPIRHIDHVVPFDAGGSTDEANTQGCCEACNHAKQASGWRQRVTDDPSGRHRVDTVTPTGHSYLSVAPAPPEPARDPQVSVLERRFSEAIAAA